jgi:single-strand DNA-binding protein
MPQPDRNPQPLNVAVLCGVLSRPAEVRTLPSGDRLATLQVTVPRAEGPDETVPVSVADPSSTVCSLDTGAAVLVTGRVRRRFFRAGGRTASATEVVAHTVVPAGRRKQAAAAVAAAAGLLTTT